MIKTAVTFALQDSKQATQKDATSYVAHAMAFLDASGATWTAHVGGYRMADGTAVFEPSYTVDVLTPEPVAPDKVQRFAKFIKSAESQESVMIEVTTVNTQFI